MLILSHGAHVDGSVNTGRGPTAVEDVISSPCRGGRRRRGHVVLGRPPGPPSDEGDGGTRDEKERGKEGAPEVRQKQEATGTTGGGVDGTSWGGRRNESADTASQPARMVTSRGGGEELRRHTWWGSETGVCVWALGEGSGPRTSRGRGGRGTPARAVPNATRRWAEPDPVRGLTSTTPLGRGSREGGGGVVAGTLSGGRAGPPSSWSSRDGRGRHVTRRGGCVAVGGFRGWKVRGPSDVDSTPPGAAPKYPDPGQQGNDPSESQGDRIWSGAGFFPPGFPNHPTTCLNFSLWRD